MDLCANGHAMLKADPGLRARESQYIGYQHDPIVPEESLDLYTCNACKSTFAIVVGNQLRAMSDRQAIKEWAVARAESQREREFMDTRYLKD